jgi:hypothetical protein
MSYLGVSLASGGGTDDHYLRETGATGNGLRFRTIGSSNNSGFKTFVPCDASQSIDYHVGAGGGGMDIDVNGFVEDLD